LSDAILTITFPSCGATIAAACKYRVDSFSNTVAVKLTTGTKFDTLKDITMSDLTGGTPTTISSAWSWDTTGELSEFSGSTSVNYQTQKIVQAGETVPSELLCYSNCPKGEGDSKSTPLAAYSDAKILADIRILAAGSCSECPTLQYQGFNVNPTISISCFQSNGKYKLSSLSVTDRGVVDVTVSVPSPTITLSYTNNACTESKPIVEANFASGIDNANLGLAWKYSFDSLSGKIYDKTASKVALTTANQWGIGPFFEASSVNKQKLSCLSSFGSYVCSWQVYQLDELFTYDTGTSNARFSVLDKLNNPTLFAPPLALFYKHSGTKSNSGINYNGVNMLLTYRGTGQLANIPQLCLDSQDLTPSNCIGWGSDASINMNDVDISPTTALTDMDGNKYYTRPARVVERFPKAANSLCAGMDLNSLPTAPDFDKLWKTPSNTGAGFPTADELKANYLNGGAPAVVNGVTFYELAGSA